MIKSAMLYEKLDEGKVQCNLCAHRCKILPNNFGFCGVRKNEGGKLYTHVYGEIIASHVDPIEKKPLYHFFPGSSSYSIATAGCNFRCGFCQNWQISQVSISTLPLPLTRDERVRGVPPKEVVQEAKQYNCRSISYTYTEPTIFFEYAYDIAILAKKNGLYNNFVTNGYMTQEALETIHPYLDACNVDLKSFSEDFYKNICNGRLQPVKDSIKNMKRLGIWVEVTTLVVPHKNDSDEELRKIAEFIADIGCEIPWHISRFHPDYRYLDSKSTSIDTLKNAQKIGQDAGLRYVYIGNVTEGNNTYCYKCGETLIQREGFNVSKYNMDEGRCKKCGAVIDGKF